MAENGKINDASVQKYNTILNEIIKGLTHLGDDLTDSFYNGHRMDAKLKIAIDSLKCIDRKYRNLLYDGEPPNEHYTTEYLEKKRKERNDIEQKLKSIRKEYYLQEEHMTKLSRTLQENERKLAMQSIKCTREGLLISRLLWTATKTRGILEKLISECATELHEFLNLTEGCIYAFSATYKDSVPDPNADEYQYVIALCGILTNLSSIPDGRLFLMWNPMGRAIYTLILDIMGTVTVRKTESLKWMMLIMIYNILVSPLGREFIFNYPFLRENLEECLASTNCANIIGATLYIIKYFVDDFIDNKDMIPVLMYQLPLKQVYSLSKSSKDINIRKLAQTIVAKMEKKMVDCNNSPSCKKFKTAGSAVLPRKKMFARKKIIVKSTVTSDFNTDSEINDTTSSIVVEKKPTVKQTAAFGEFCETPSLKAKCTKKLTVKTLFKPISSKSLDISNIELRGHSTGRLEGLPPLRPKSKSEERITRDKLMNVDRKTVIDMLSKLDLDTYLRPSYDEFGIPLKSDDCSKCCPRKGKSQKENVDVARKTSTPQEEEIDKPENIQEGCEIEVRPKSTEEQTSKEADVTINVQQLTSGSFGNVEVIIRKSSSLEINKKIDDVGDKCVCFQNKESSQDNKEVTSSESAKLTPEETHQEGPSVESKNDEKNQTEDESKAVNEENADNTAEIVETEIGAENAKEGEKKPEDAV